MFMHFMKRSGLVALLAFVLTACGSGSQKTVDLQTEPAQALDSTWVKVTEGAVDPDLTLTIYSKQDTLHTEFETLYFHLTNKDGQVVNNAPFHIEPVMDMGEQGHGIPTMQPVYNDKTQAYEGGVFFSMQGYYDIKMQINGKEATASRLFAQYKRGTDHLFKIDDGVDGKLYATALMSPNSWKIGENNFTLLVDEVVNNVMEFNEVPGLVVEVFLSGEVEGHETRYAPITLKDEGRGRYSGTVEIPAEGKWELNYSLKNGKANLVPEGKLSFKL